MSKTETMSVQEALNKLKLTDNKLERKVSETGKFTAVKSEKGWVTVGINKDVTEEKFKQESKSAIDSIADLIKYRHALKSAILKSNATTVVKIGKKEMTVAEAIDFKSTKVADLEFIETLEHSYVSSLNVIERKKQKLEEKVQREISNIPTDNKDDAYKGIVELFEARAEKEAPHLVAPVMNKNDDFLMYLQDERTKIEEFDSSVDLVLTKSNILTEITVEW